MSVELLNSSKLLSRVHLERLRRVWGVSWVPAGPASSWANVSWEGAPGRGSALTLWGEPSLSRVGLKMYAATLGSL